MKCSNHHHPHSVSVDHLILSRKLYVNVYEYFTLNWNVNDKSINRLTPAHFIGIYVR